MTEIVLTDEQRQRVLEATADLANYIDNQLRTRVGSVLGHHAGMPERVVDFGAKLAGLRDAVAESARPKAPRLHETNAPILATVVAYGRRRFVGDLEERRGRALTGDVHRRLDAARAAMDELLSSTWYRKATPLPLPRVRDFVAPGRGDTRPPPPPPRPLDDKFGILYRASDLPNDLKTMREECDERRAPVAIAFVDVDGLKALNADLGETQVDALVLPPLMRAIERAVFGHGSAYRHGGDEFVVLSPSAGREVALALLRALRGDLATITFEGVATPPTVSIGLCVVRPDSPLTDGEALWWATLAKKEAKKTRNVVGLIEAGREIGTPSIEVLDD